MAWMLLANGAPDEPDTGDWDAICSTPGPRQIFAALFEELSSVGMPARTTTEVSENETHRVHRNFRAGNPVLQDGEEGALLCAST